MKDGDKTKERLIGELFEERVKTKALEKEISNIASTVSEGILEANLKGVVTSCNKAFCKLTGFNEDAIVGKHFTKLPTLRTRDLPKYVKMFAKLLIGKVPKSSEFKWMHKNKTEHYAEASIRIIRKRGKIKGFQVFLKDITERKRAEEELWESEEKYKTLTEDAPIGIYLNDFGGTFLYGNKKAEEIIGYKSEELLGKSFLKLKLLDIKGVGKGIKLLALNKLGKATGPDDFVLNRKDGSKKIVEIRTRIVTVGGKKVVLGMVEDITEHKQAEEELKAAEARYQDLYENAPDMYVSVDPNTAIILRCNQTVATNLGYTKREIVGHPIFDMYHPDCMDDVKRAFQSFVETGEVRNAQLQLKRKDGTKIDVSLNVSAVRDDQGNILYSRSAWRDVTERKQAEERVQESEEKYRSLFEQMLNGFAYCKILVDENNQPIDFVYLEVNDTFERLTGLRREKVIGKKVTEAIPGIKEAHPELFSIYGKVALTGEPTKFDIYFEPLAIWLTISVYSPQKGYFVAIFDNITERKRVEEELQRAAEEWRATFDSVVDLVSIHDKDFKLVRVNRAYANAFKMRPEELIGKTCYAVVHGTKKPRPGCPHKQTLETKEPARLEFFEPRLGVHLEISASPIFDDRGEVIASIHVARDITERKRAEEALRESEASLAKAQQITHLGNFDWNVKDNTSHLSDEYYRIFGLSPRQSGFTYEEFISHVHPNDREFVKRKTDESFYQKAPYHINYRIILPNGSERIVHSDAEVALDEAGEPVRMTGIIQDITKRKQAEEREKQLQAELYLSSRLASIGELAAGVAHEINNPLTGIIGFSELLMRKSTDETAKRNLQTIHSEAWRAAKIVENLLTFARQRKLEKKYADINDILQKALELRAYELKTSNIKVETDLAPGLPEIMTDFHQVQEVFLNIILNAEQAMTEANRRGKLSIKTQEIKGYIRISFVDNGSGISAEHLDKLFDPFFTTRGEKGGTGLGLSICHGIITEHGGQLYAKSKPGKGATFFIELPLTDEKDEQE